MTDQWQISYQFNLKLSHSLFRLSNEAKESTISTESLVYAQVTIVRRNLKQSLSLSATNLLTLKVVRYLYLFYDFLQSTGPSQN